MISDIDRLRDLLDRCCLGRENALPLRRLAAALGWSRRETEQVLHELRQLHGVYVSCGAGIYRATRRDDLTAYRLQLLSRRQAMDNTLAAVERELSSPAQMRFAA